jgi:hypothetical protein
LLSISIVFYLFSSFVNARIDDDEKKEKVKKVEKDITQKRKNKIKIK